MITDDLTGRTALVTGATSGIGKATAIALARQGARVLVAGRDKGRGDAVVAAIRADGGEAGFLQGDLHDALSAKDLAQRATQAAGGQIDVLVNNAGTSQRGAFEEVSDELWQNDIDLKLFAAIRLCRQAFPGMKARRWGRIINILNIGAKAPQATSAPTSVTRAAGMALTKVLSAEGAPHNVLVNALLVGRIQSNQWVKRHATEGKGRSLEAYYAEMGKSIPMGRLGTADEFANMALFLASDAGSYITGTAINIDGGSSPVV